MKALPFNKLIDRLEIHYGPQEPCWPTDPYQFLVWWHCGYPASDHRCCRGWAALAKVTEIDPQSLRKRTVAELAVPLKAGGMVPELRAQRLHEIARRVLDSFDGDLTALLERDVPEVRRELRKFPGMGDPGVDRILLFARKAPIAAIPSNCPHAAVRLVSGIERPSYSATYREAQAIVDETFPHKVDARQRAYLVLKVHGQEICKRTPRCDVCPVHDRCEYAERTARKFGDTA